VTGGGGGASATVPKAHSDEIAPQKRPAKRQRTNSHPPGTQARVAIDIHFDGGSRGNPGAAGAGAHIEITTEQEGGSICRKTVQVRKYLGTKATNNFAEYHGLICGLEEAKNVAINFKPTSVNDKIHLKVRGDSDLIIRQMNGSYQCKSANLIPLHKEAKSLVVEMNQVAPMEISFEHVYRQDNSVADGKYRRKESVLFKLFCGSLIFFSFCCL